MSDEPSRRERWKQADDAENQRHYEEMWGINHEPDARAALPERLAWEARQRGDRLFQIDLPVSFIQGAAGSALVGPAIAATRTRRPEYRDALGAIEAQGWKLEHVSTAFVTHGAAGIKATAATSHSATHGTLMGLYVFRAVCP